MTNALQTIRWARQDALNALADAGIPLMLLTNLTDLTRLAGRVGYIYKTAPLTLLTQIGPMQFCRELNREVHHWWC